MGLELNGKCLAYHGPLLYEAKVLRIWDPRDQKISYYDEADNKRDEETLKEDVEAVPVDFTAEVCYFIHYQGWKSTWDEWIGPDRIREYNDENVALRKKLIQDAKETKKQQQEELKKRKQAASAAAGAVTPNKKKHGESNTSGSGSLKSAAGNSKSRSSSTPNITDNSSSGHITSTSNSSSNSSYTQQYNNLISHNIPKITLHMPIKLKCILVDDWEFVTKDKKLCKLPKKDNQSINHILETYRNDAIAGGLSLVEQSLLDEYILGLKLYFNECLSQLLLYRLEKLQYSEVRKTQHSEEIDLCEIYGSVHLLRLISILPELMSDTTMGTQNCQVIIKQSESLLLWLVVHMSDIFDTTTVDSDGDQYYINTSSQYEGLALGM